MILDQSTDPADRIKETKEKENIKEDWKRER